MVSKSSASSILEKIKMNSPVVFVLLVLIFAYANVQGLEDLLNTPIQKCLNCVCHARSGCWSRFNCARYSISKDYWKIGGSHALGSHPDSDAAYRWCMNNENCILNTIKSYTESFGNIDCNCDGAFDCKDRMAIHLFGKECFNPKYGSVYATRFNHCAGQIGVRVMLDAEDYCNLAEVDPV